MKNLEMPVKSKLSLAWDKFQDDGTPHYGANDETAPAEARRVVAVVVGQTWQDVRRNGVLPTPLPRHGPWERVPALDGVYLSDTYGLCLALTHQRAGGTLPRPVLLVEVDMDRLNPLRFAPDPAMDNQVVMLVQERGLEALGELGIPFGLAHRPEECLRHFGTVWHQATIPPEAVRRAVALNDPGSKWMGKIPARFASITSFKNVRRYFKPLHDWIIDGAPGMIPLTTATDKSILSDEAEWFRQEMSEAIRESLDVLT